MVTYNVCHVGKFQYQAMNVLKRTHVDEKDPFGWRMWNAICSEHVRLLSSIQSFSGLWPDKKCMELMLPEVIFYRFTIISLCCLCKHMHIKLFLTTVIFDILVVCSYLAMLSTGLDCLQYSFGGHCWQCCYQS